MEPGGPGKHSANLVLRRIPGLHPPPHHHLGGSPRRFRIVFDFAERCRNIEIACISKNKAHCPCVGFISARVGMGFRVPAGGSWSVIFVPVGCPTSPLRMAAASGTSAASGIRLHASQYQFLRRSAGVPSQHRARHRLRIRGQARRRQATRSVKLFACTSSDGGPRPAPLRCAGRMPED